MTHQSLFLFDCTHSSTPINSTDIFFAFINALATIAPVPNATPFHSFQAASRSGEYVISIVATGQGAVDYNFIKKALRIPIQYIMLVLLNIGEMTLGLNWGTVKLAEMTMRPRDRGAIAQS